MKNSINSIKRSVLVLLFGLVAAASLSGCVVREDHDHWHEHEHEHWEHDHWEHDHP